MTEILTDDELVLKFKKGQKECFEELVFRYKNSLYQYILSMVRDEGTAGDIFQEVFINFFKNVEKYNPQGKFKAWLFMSARNRILNFFRDKDKLYSLDETDENGEAYLQDMVAGNDLPPLEQLSNEELGRSIRKASLELPQKQREVIYLRQYLSFKEIAQMVGRPIGSVLAEHHRGIKKMQQLLSGKEVSV